MNRIQGVLPILNTTFHQDGSIDLDSQLRLVDYLLDAGAHGLGLFGNASEGYALLEDERRFLLKHIARQVDGRVPLIVSSGHTGTEGAVRASKEAQDLGASCLMVLPPFFMKTDGEGLMHYYDAISRAVSIPIMVQDAPLMTQIPMPAPLLVRMSREIERVKYVKVEAPPTPAKVTHILAAKPDVTLLGGLNGNFLIEEYERGARGVMPGSDLIPQFVEIWNLLESGRSDEAWRSFVHILPLVRFELQPGLGVSAMKYNLASRGVIACAKVRHPTGSVDARGFRELDRLRSWVDSAESVVTSAVVR